MLVLCVCVCVWKKQSRLREIESNGRCTGYNFKMSEVASLGRNIKQLFGRRWKRMAIWGKNRETKDIPSRES